LTRTFGQEGNHPGARRRVVDTIVLDCKLETVRVHPSGAALTPGRKRNDDSMVDATWSPPGTDVVSGAIVCPVPSDDTKSMALAFTHALTFVAKNLRGLDVAGVEWAFVNSDACAGVASVACADDARSGQLRLGSFGAGAVRPDYGR
jgi:hypothetical protein